MKTLSYSWKVIINIITVGIVFAVFQIASDPFETAVISVLVLIYINIISFSSTWGMTTLEVNEALDRELQDIKKLLRKTNVRSDIDEELNDDEYTEEYKKELEEEKVKAKKHLKTKYYINITFQFIIYLIALGYLFSAISN